MEKRYYTPKEASVYLGVSVSALNQWRMQNKYLKFIKLGRKILYDVKELDSIGTRYLDRAF